MSHPEQLGFFAAVAKVNQPLVEGGRILEIGSYDVNGTVRRVFESSRAHVGIDLAEGPGVDHVGFGHDYDEPDGSFDIALSGECFEHDTFWPETFANMVRLVRPGGLVAFTCASRGRPEHGTARSDASLSPGTQHVGLDYYRNLTEADFAPLPLAEWFGEWRFWYLPTSFDLYFAGRRAGATGARLPTDADVRALTAVMPFPHRLARLPLRLVAATGVAEDRYQDLVLGYWQFLLRVVGDRAFRRPDCDLPG
jgi:SAM-dependent methyltransferase